MASQPDQANHIAESNNAPLGEVTIGGAARHFTVFISSTFLDNEKRRTLVEDAILRAKMQPVGMEHFTASAKPTVEECQRLARECDVYLGIIAHRYGWIPEGQTTSITELEYDAAKEKGRPRLMFEISPSVPVHPDQDFDQGKDRWAKQENLEAFKAKYQADQMPARFEENKLGLLVYQALHEWQAKQQGGDSPSPQPRTEAAHLEPELQNYLAAVENQHHEIPLAGFKTRLRVPIDLEDLYVPLRAMVDLRGSGDSRFADSEEAESKLGIHGAAEIPLKEAFQRAQACKRRHLVILGDPGSGKTTHLKRLLLACLREGPASLGLAAGTLPVFLPLRDLDDISQGIPAFIEKTLDSPHLNMPQGFGKRLLQRGHLLLLFDGLDEVSNAQHRAKVARWIESAVQAWPSCHAVVTCRFAGYDEHSRLDAGFLELHLRPLSEEQSESFIRNWYKTVETGLNPGPSGEILAAEKAQELIDRLRGPDFRSARMATMTRNPLLLTNLCLVHRDRGGILPKGRHALYDECIEVLLERWREAKPLKDGKSLGVSIPAELGRQALQPVALWLHREEGRTRASAAELAPLLEPALKAARWDGGDAQQFLQTLRDESGLLTGWSHDQYGFMHLGFQEYLAAREISRLAIAEALSGGKPQALVELATHYGESWWQEVILLLLALPENPLFKPFMTEALKQPGFAEDRAFLDLVLEDTADLSPAPFADFLWRTYNIGSALTSNQITALTVLQRLFPDEVKPLAKIINNYSKSNRVSFDISQTETTVLVSRRSKKGGLELLHIPGGRFMMGSSKDQGDDDEHPAHEVEIRPFYLGRYPVTNEEYAQFLKANPKVKPPEFWANRQFNQARQPVVGVDWEDACHFAQWAGGRLPTEAEWEYAARAGSNSPYFWGESDAEAGEYAWYRGNSQGTTHPVGEKRPNDFGLYDMAGNVWEWVQDRWHETYDGAPADGSAWDSGDDGRRAVRGGAWFNIPNWARSAYRNRRNPTYRYFNLGFRLAQD